ncbi:exodeoxyribonuclease VII small subunit [Thermococcus sp.]
MRKLMALTLAFLMLGTLLVGSVYATDSKNSELYKEEFYMEVFLSDNGDAKIIMKNSLLGPQSKVDEFVSQILNQTNMTNEQAIKKYEAQLLNNYIIQLKNSGLETTNQTLHLLGVYNGTHNVTLVFTAYAKSFAKYYSYNKYWELILDPTRGLATSPVPDSGLPYGSEIRNIFVIHLPKDVKLLEYPKPYTMEFNHSKFYVRSKVEGNTVIVSSDIILEAYLGPEGYKALFGKYDTFYVRYTTPNPGKEEYKTSIVTQEIIAKVLDKLNTELVIRQIFIKPEQDVDYFKAYIKMLGVKNATNMILQNNVKYLSSQGVVIKNASAQIYGLNDKGPLILETRYLVQNFTKIVNGTYEYSFAPTLGVLNGISYRAKEESNQTLKIQFLLPKGAKIVKLPEEINRNVNGNKFILKTTVKDNNITVISNIYIRYGALREDVQKLLGNVSEAHIAYTLPEKRKSAFGTKEIAGIIGAVVLIGAVLLILKRR